MLPRDLADQDAGISIHFSMMCGENLFIAVDVVPDLVYCKDV